MTYIGTLHYNDIGSGGWQLKCVDGNTYDLFGDIPSTLANRVVSIIAKPISGMGFMMGGAALQVERIQEDNK